ncbi:hypothetical protein [Pelagicoccus mobilis]|uniref:DUF2029 domain-containing protein n=1 Tax=Pelagicoccus mobilis TaxID=415221 RepID=A0A934RWJ1_9BACT|nr:hypothetical protein [Pelagicoccus mobilis]MBK1876076.1 hypothetical protein [Pelagicoccus mobilis]
MRGNSALFNQASGSSRQPSFYRTKRRDYVLPVLAATLVLLGSFRMVGFSDLSVADNVSKFQISFGFIALGYLLSWHFAKRMTWLMLLVAAVARIAMLPIEPGEILERRLWDSQILAAEHNPYELAPEAERLTAFRGENWEEMEDKSTPSSYLPGLLWVYSAFEEFGNPRDYFKSVLIVVDLLLCLLFALRFGAERAVLYAWNPLVIYAVGGLGVDHSLFLLPFAGGFLMWDFWIDQKGGVSVIKAAGGIGSALGQMVCVSALLMGMGAALNVLLVPGVLWLIWHVLKRSGIRAGLVALVFGAAPLVLTLMWASISLNVDISRIVAPEYHLAERAVSLIPSITGFFYTGSLSPMVFLGVLGLATVWMLHVCESMERFLSFYLVWTIALATSVFPWSFILLAIVGVGSGNYVFRVASLSAFAYFGAYRVFADTQVWSMPWTLQALLWIPFLLAAAHYTVGSRTKQGFYVHHF